MSDRPTSLVGRVSNLPFVREPKRRRLVFALLIVICGILTFYPQKYRAAVSLTPTDPASLGLSGTLGQLGAVGGVFGNQAAVEVSLKVARSDYVRDIVSREIDLAEKLDGSRIDTLRWLEDTVEIRALRGGILQFEVKLYDPDLAQQIIAAYGDAVRAQLAIISRNQTSYKREILTELVATSGDRLDRARAAFNNFRLRTRYTSPEAAINEKGDVIPYLEGAIRAKEAKLNAQRQFATDENILVRQTKAEIASLKQQLAEASAISTSNMKSVGQLVELSTKVEKLRRELALAQNLYDSYKRYLQGTFVEDLTSTANIRILEPAYIDTTRQINILPLVAGLLILLVALAVEFYAIRPPLEARAPA